MLLENKFYFEPIDAHFVTFLCISFCIHVAIISFVNIHYHLPILSPFYAFSTLRSFVCFNGLEIRTEKYYGTFTFFSFFLLIFKQGP